MKKTLIPIAIALAFGAAAPAFAQSKGDWTLGVGVHQVNPKSDNGTLAGSTLNINKGLRILVEEAMVPFNYALNACTINPARCLHLDDRKGSIQIGKDADLVVLDDNYDVLQTYCMGKAQL